MTTLEAVPGPWSAQYRTTTIGVFALAFLVAFESLAVTTVMAVVADDLHGLRFYGLAFAMPMAVSTFGLILTGPWMDGRGPAQPRRLGIGVFAAGLVVAGLAQSMTAFLLGRAAQGFGAGLVGVGLVLMLEHSDPGQEGMSSSALQGNDAMMQAISVPIGSAAFSALLDRHAMLAYLINFGGAFVLGLVATLAAPRLLKPS